MYKVLEAVYGREYIFRQLAEECAELAQASLKLIRAEREETPVSAKEAMAGLLEEIADVRIMIDVAADSLTRFQTEQTEVIRQSKLKRMLKRAEAKVTVQAE